MQVFAPQLKILASPEAVDQYAADVVLTQIKQKPESVFSVPTGATPKGMYQLLVAAYQKGQVDFSRVTVFSLDEYYPIKHTHPSSYHTYMRNVFYKEINIPQSQQFLPDGEAIDADRESRRYDQLLQDHGPVDLTILGIGPGTTCHIGFNEKGSLVDSRVRYVELEAETKAVNAKFFANQQEMPSGAISQGITNILESKKILLIAKGEGKAWGIRRMLTGEVSSEAPASFLRFHPKAAVIVDSEAGKLVR